MKKFIVRYYLSENEQERLSRITERYKAGGISLSMEEIFEAVMQAGSRHDIERKLGLMEDQQEV